MSITTEITAEEKALANSILERMTTDLSLIIDRDFRVENVKLERSLRRPAGGPEVHISFKLEIEREGESRHGCLLVPLPDAIALAGFMMMRSDETVARERSRTELDGPFKEALLEVGKFMAGACDSVLRRALPESATRSDGCQGVRANVRPALVYREGDALLVARARARLHRFEPFEMMLVLPSLQGSLTTEMVSV